MYEGIILSTVLSIAAIISILCLLSIFAYDKSIKTQVIDKRNNREDWLFSNFQVTIFNLVYKKPKGDKLCGISQTEYNRYCKILHIKPDLKNIVALRIEAVFIVFLMFIISYFTSSSITVVCICFMVVAFAMYAFWVSPYAKIKLQAEERLYKIEDDLPRFLSLLEKAMDLPIDQAMMVTSSKFESPLSDDIMDSINKVALGANGWAETLIELAKIYKIEDFSDLILEIVNSYEQGVNVRSLVTRKAKEVEQSRLYSVEAHDSKIKTLIFLPIIIFKVVPLMILICFPMMKDFI